MNNKSFFSIAIAFLASAFVLVQAQPPKPPSLADRLKHVTEKVDKDLSINAQQKEQLIAAFKNFFVAMDALHKEQAPPPPPNKAAVEKLLAVRDEKIKSILTAEEFIKYTRMEKAMRPKHEGPHPPMGNKMPPPERNK